MTTPTDKKQRVRTLGRGLVILDRLKDLGPLTLTEMATELGLDKSTILRLMNTLRDFGFVEYDDDNRKYYLGLQLIMYGRRVANDLQLRRVALPYLERLQQSSNEAVALGVPHGDKVLWVDGVRRRTVEGIGQPWWVKASYMHCTSAGKAMLAYLPDEETVRIHQHVGFPKRTEKTITEVNVLREELHQIRERGYAIDDAENFDGLSCIGATIFGPDDKVIGAISITFPTKRFEKKYASVVPALRQACIDVSRTMDATAVSLIKLASYD